MARAADPTIRDASRADLLSVVRIERTVFSDPWPYDAFERLLDAPAFLVAELDPDRSDADADRPDADAESRSDADVRSDAVLDEPPSIDAGPPIVGYVVADVTPNFGRDIGHIKDLAVHPAVQGRGIGRQLLRAALARLRFRDASVVKLEVREGNDRARSLYGDQGFAPLRRVSRYYADGEDAIVMVLDLEDWTPS
ncbi:GNAT family N-acetyltransferase [Halopenitus persicus]|uniref:GNAT family N-acetyltransferase n=1 Tax=Halopenitus persicus TaxID=1048396 RepID=UPI001E50B154|nr:GNAT family N-acetyltransferase [Halopenitus persicus]